MLEIVQMPLASLSEYANNAKIHDEANVEAIRASIRRFGNCDPIGVWTAPDGTVEIVEGHGRKMALEAEGYSAPWRRTHTGDDGARIDAAERKTA